MKKFNYDDYISHSYFKFKVENVDKNIHIDYREGDKTSKR